MEKHSVAWGSGLLAVAVGLGAFGAHGLKALIDPAALANWNTAVHYQFIHGLGILVLAALTGPVPASATRRIRNLFLVGIACFCGSLYLLSTRELNGLDGMTAFIGPITPLGGVMFIVGWIGLLITVIRSKG